MTEILMRSDFAIKVSFYDIKGKAIALKKFKLSYSTQLSTPIIATFDGTTYSDNCTPTENGVIIQFNNPKLNVGQLRVVRELAIGSSTFSDGVRDIRQEELLPIQIVQSYSRTTTSPSIQPTAITSSQDDLLCIENVILDSQVGPTGEKGAPGTPAMDYSLLAEQIVPGEFWYSADGVRKQIYTQTFKGTLPPINHGDKGILLHFGYASSIFYHSAFYRTANDVKIPISIYNDNNWLNTAIIEFSTVAEAKANVGRLYVATIKYIK